VVRLTEVQGQIKEGTLKAAGVAGLSDPTPSIPADLPLPI